MKLALLYSLLIYQLQSSDAVARICQPLETVSANRIVVNPGKDYPFNYIGTCLDGDPTYYLYHQNHENMNLDFVSKNESYGATIENVQMKTSGVYCMQLQCTNATATTATPIDQCCIQLEVPKELRIILPDEIYTNSKQDGVCFISGWPRPEDMSFHTHGCGMMSKNIQVIDLYTIAAFFTLQDISNSCENITCQSYESDYISKPIHIRQASSSNQADANYTSNDQPNNCNKQHSGTLGIHRITLWIIVLVISLVNTAVISLL